MKTNPNRSLHILADLYQCQENPEFLTSVRALKKAMLAMVKRSGFKIVFSRFHKFPPGANVTEGGITGVVVVSESHLAIHTWPEKNFANIDVFFCSYSRDNSKKAQKVFSEFSTLYKPKRVRKRNVWRD